MLAPHELDDCLASAVVGGTGVLLALRLRGRMPPAGAEGGGGLGVSVGAVASVPEPVPVRAAAKISATVGRLAKVSPVFH